MLKLHYKYIYNKVISILILTILLFLGIYFLYEASSLENFVYKWFNQKKIYENYYISSMILVKLIIPIISIYLFGSSFLDNLDGYSKIIIKYRNERIYYFFTKVLIICIIIFVLLILVYYLYFYIGLYNIPNFLIYYRINYEFINIFLLSILMGFITLVFSLMFKHQLVYIIFIIIYVVISMIQVDDSYFISFISIFVPILLNDYHFLHNYVYIISYALLLLFLNTLIYYVKDF